MICAHCNEPLKEHEQPMPGRAPECTACRSARLKSKDGQRQSVNRALDAFAARQGGGR